MCYRCFWPQSLCWCPTLLPLVTQTRFLFLMHPKEYKQEKAGTGRLVQLCLPNSSLHMGVEFDRDERVAEMMADPRYFPVLLYPGRAAWDLSAPDGAGLASLRAGLGSRALLVVLLDGTWSSARKMLRLSPGLQRLPRIMFRASQPSRYVIKQQPQDGCLSTLEATHELLLLLERAGLDRYDNPTQLLGIFGRMQDFQLRCASDPALAGYRHRAYKPAAERAPLRGRSATRRENYLQQPAAPSS